MRAGWRRAAAALLRQGMGQVTMIAALIGAEAADPVLRAAADALRAGQAMTSLTLLRDHPSLDRPGPARVIIARAQHALGRSAEALTALGADRADKLLHLIGAWPEAQRGTAAQVAALALADRAGDPRLIADLIRIALAAPGGEVDDDRCLLLLAETTASLGDAATARRAATIVWRQRPSSPVNVRAGLFLAQLLSGDPAGVDEAGAILAAIASRQAATDPERSAAADLHCRMLLAADRPGACLAVAELELARAAAPAPVPNRLRLHRALALAAMGDAGAAATLDALPGDLRRDPAASAARARIGAQAAEDPARVVHGGIERARASLALGRADQAQALLIPLAARSPLALCELLALPGVDPRSWVGSPLAGTPAVALALVEALTRAGEADLAWSVARSAIDRAGDGASSALLYAAAAVAPTERAAHLHRRLLDRDAPDVQTGQAWCEEAQRCERAGADARPAWRHAERRLPPAHPWRAAAAWRLARPLLADGSDLPSARDLLTDPAWAGESDEHLRCRFMLAQVLERLSDRRGALAAAESLRGHGDAQRRARIDALIARLRAGDGALAPP